MKMKTMYKVSIESHETGKVAVFITHNLESMTSSDFFELETTDAKSGDKYTMKGFIEEQLGISLTENQPELKD